jgi:CRISPR/Cas system-associated exonuclease Cas4 (RecB family)
MNLTAYLDDFCLQRQQHDTAERDHSKFRVSDAGKCRLMRYWKRQGKPTEPTYTPEILRAMHVGILLHNWIQDVIKQTGHALAIEQTLEDEHRIGHLDALVRSDDQTILYDFKTINGKKWYYLEKGGFIPDLTHYAQLITYAFMLPTPPDETILLYLNRDTLAIKEVVIPEDTILNKAILEDWRILVDGWHLQEEPIANPANWECPYCAYQHTCSAKR